MGTDFWIGLLIGVIAGWLIEWIIDRVYWRKRLRLYTDQLEKAKDTLRDIKGVGKLLENRLNEAGIFSFHALADLSEEDLDLIAGDALDFSEAREVIRRAGKKAKKKVKKKAKKR